MTCVHFLQGRKVGAPEFHVSTVLCNPRGGRLVGAPETLNGLETEEVGRVILIVVSRASRPAPGPCPGLARFLGRCRAHSHWSCPAF
jgi:hypothetical protein